MPGLRRGQGGRETQITELSNSLLRQPNVTHSPVFRGRQIQSTNRVFWIELTAGEGKPRGPEGATCELCSSAMSRRPADGTVRTACAERQGPKGKLYASVPHSSLEKNLNWHVLRDYYTPVTVLRTCQVLLPLNHITMKQVPYVTTFTDEKTVTQLPPNVAQLLGDKAESEPR